MKRSVAILGPTPPFVRWAILHECSLRQLESENLPDVTFRQLRGLRELSVGMLECRVWEGICIHPDATSAAPKQALGFPINEVIDAYGDEQFVASCCTNCPANSVARDQPGIWAGCYGWLPTSADFSFEISSKHSRRTRSETSAAQRPTKARGESDQLLVDLLEDVVQQHALIAEMHALFPETSPRWYGIWQNQQLNSQQVEFLIRVFEALVAQVSSMTPGSFGFTFDLLRFLSALRCCREHSLELHVDLIPPGISDGTTWTQFAHCPTCKCALKYGEPATQICPACGRKGNPHGERKGKVLGLRPYVNLCGVLGEPGTRDFLERFELRATARSE